MFTGLWTGSKASMRVDARLAYGDLVQ